LGKNLEKGGLNYFLVLQSGDKVGIEKISRYAYGRIVLRYYVKINITRLIIVGEG
jgi:hypothetical protein